MELFQLAPWQFAVDSLLNGAGMNAVAPSKNIAVIVFSLRTFYVKKLLNPVKKVFYTTVFFPFRLNWER
ncbi:hypothetical protein CDG76_27805 [Nostoc sp. 'Peltigera membranacea cyanobiont' 210A]|uniref:hypothetical protein n=1 Tax=Nostoc sp. 'Peltigera membranacea cyanobiont' 210A TaxID=2014529 RepID=UPI000B95481F|nr:hypothetical protein [Nostoc sp. 'Peltigera membranacea cyanobiont' 210A]OYD91677.1 hypothetical protein CDG76_27805 [Nostoc sp. 'Peltigera membranacea cyanobiont' 210A]